jgi:hypothetical protein
LGRFATGLKNADAAVRWTFGAYRRHDTAENMNPEIKKKNI